MTAKWKAAIWPTWSRSALPWIVPAEGTHFQGASEGRTEGTVFVLHNLVCSQEEIVPAERKWLESIFQIPLEGALLVLWKTSLYLDLHDVSKWLNRKNLALSCSVQAVMYSDVLFLSFAFLNMKDYYLQTGCPSTLSALEDPHTYSFSSLGSAACVMQDLCWVSQAGWHCGSHCGWKAWCKLRKALALLHFRQDTNIHVYLLLLEKERKLSNYPVGRMPSGVCWSGELYFSWQWVIMHFIKLRVKNAGGWFGFFSSFSMFWLPKNSMNFFKRKDEGSCFWDQWQDTRVQFSSLCMFALWYGKHCTTSASQHCCCSLEFSYSWPSLTENLILVGPQNENIPTMFIFYFPYNFMREGCTSAARGCSNSGQEIPQSRNIYICWRHWCSVLVTVAWAEDQDVAHILSLPSGIKVRKQNIKLKVKLWKEGLRGDFSSPVLTLPTLQSEHPDLPSSTGGRVL